MGNTNKQLAKIKAEFAETLFNLADSIEDFIDEHTIPTGIYGLERDSGEEFTSDARRFTKVYASDLKSDSDNDEEPSWPVTLRQINLAFALYSVKAVGEEYDSVRDIYTMLTKLLGLCEKYKDELDDITQEIEATLEETTKVESRFGLSSIVYDEGFDPSDIFGDVAVLRDNIVLILNELVIDAFGGQKTMVQQMKKAAEEMADEETEESK